MSNLPEGICAKAELGDEKKRKKRQALDQATLLEPSPA